MPLAMMAVSRGNITSIVPYLFSGNRPLASPLLPDVMVSPAELFHGLTDAWLVDDDTSAVGGDIRRGREFVGLVGHLGRVGAGSMAERETTTRGSSGSASEKGLIIVTPAID